jgi:hypothetical protein
VPTLLRIRQPIATKRRRRAFAGAAIAIALVLVAVAVLVASSGSPRRSNSSPSSTTTLAPAQLPPATEQFGANVGRLFNDRAYTPAQIDAQLAALRQTGATLARSDALWEATEPTRPSRGAHRYDWSFDDSIASALAAHGLRWLPIIDYSAPWAHSIAGQDHSPPASTSDYADYAAALARRYGPGGSFWNAHPGLPRQPVDTYEIWNEPDNPAFWSPAPDAAQYAGLYLSARAAVDSVQPDAQVIVGGLTHPAAFIAAMVAADPSLRGHIDGIGIHPYGSTPEAVLSAVRLARQALNSLDMVTVPLYVTEFGWTIHPAGALYWAPETQRPGYLTHTLAEIGHVNCGVVVILLYAWFTPERNPANPQDWFGISSPSGGSTPDTIAFAQGLRAADTAGAAVRVCS